MRKVVLGLAAAAVLAAGSALAVDAKMASDKRVESMKEMAGAMKAISEVAKGNAEASAETVSAAKKVNMVAGQIPELFPEGTVHYRAKPEIWSNKQDFMEAAKTLETESAKLVSATETKDAGQIGTALEATGKACGACHDDFRGPKPGE